jgi:hypothetical protein
MAHKGYHKRTLMERKYPVFAQGSENVKLKVAYFPRPHFCSLEKKLLLSSVMRWTFLGWCVDTIIEEHVLHLITLRRNAQYTRGMEIHEGEHVLKAAI